MTARPGIGLKQLLAHGAALAALLSSGFAAAGCAATAPRQLLAASAALEGRPRTVFLPLENLTDEAARGQQVNEIFFVAFTRSGLFEPVESGEMLDALRELRIRHTGSLSHEHIGELGARLDARLILLGTILECGTATTRDGPVPALGVSLRLLDVETRRVVWTDAHIRTGEDREGVFGLGREESFERLTTETADEMFDQLRSETLERKRVKERS